MNTPPIFTQAALDRIKPAKPSPKNRALIYIHPECHPSSGALVRYEYASGIIEVVCSHCSKVAAKIKVAP
jgi:hypothetical protein